MFLKDPGLYYEVHGEGKPLVLLNGIMMNTMSWAEHIPDLKDHYQVITYDMRDQGQSSRLEEGYRIDVHAEDLKKLLDHLGLRTANILGVSYGGQVALIFSLKFPGNGGKTDPLKYRGTRGSIPLVHGADVEAGRTAVRWGGLF